LGGGLGAGLEMAAFSASVGSTTLGFESTTLGFESFAWTEGLGRGAESIVLGVVEAVLATVDTLSTVILVGVEELAEGVTLFAATVVVGESAFATAGGGQR
jgi:hypothetical protein